MAALDAIVIPTLGPWFLLGLESYFLETAASGRSAPVMLVYGTAGRRLSLGRYHAWDGPCDRNGVEAWRRLSGGRVTGSGEGWIGVAMVLPHRTAMLSARDSTIAPAQVINRHIRGLIAGLGTLGLRAFYPGRDTLTINRRVIAVCSFEINQTGAILFEAMVAVRRGMQEATEDLDRFDAEGQLTSHPYGPDSATTLAREIGHAPTFEQVAEAIIAGYSSSADGVRRRDLTAEECARAKDFGAAMETAGWLRGTAGDGVADATARVGAQLGTVEARVGIAPDGSIERFQLLGDFIANSSAIGRLEHTLRGKKLDFDAVSEAVTTTLGDGDNFILGVGDLPSLARLIARAQ